MAHTVAQVFKATTDIIGTNKQTITDVTVATNSETVTAAELGLTTIFTAIPLVFTGQATDTGTVAKAVVASGGASIALTETDAAGTAATTAANTVIRVFATGV